MFEPVLPTPTTSLNPRTRLVRKWGSGISAGSMWREAGVQVRQARARQEGARAVRSLRLHVRSADARHVTAPQARRRPCGCPRSPAGPGASRPDPTARAGPRAGSGREPPVAPEAQARRILQRARDVEPRRRRVVLHLLAGRSKDGMEPFLGDHRRPPVPSGFTATTSGRSPTRRCCASSSLARNRTRRLVSSAITGRSARTRRPPRPRWPRPGRRGPPLANRASRRVR